MARLTEPFDSAGKLDAFLANEGLSWLRKLGADAVVPQLSQLVAVTPRVVSGLQRHRFTDFASKQGVQRYGYALGVAGPWLEVLPLAASRFINVELAALAAARQELEGRLAPPDAEVALPLHRALLQLRQQFDSMVPPRSAEALFRAELRFELSLPGFRFHEARRWLAEQNVTSVWLNPEVTLTLSDEQATARCTCGTPHCLHALAALDAALVWLKGPLTAERAEALTELSRPRWQRALRALDAALGSAPRLTGEEALGWGVKVDGARVEVTPHKMSAGRRSSRVSLNELRALERSLPEHDLRVAALYTRPAASHALLLSLEGHPGLFLEENPEQSLSIERAQVGLVAEERSQGVVLSAGVDGTPLTPAQTSRARAPSSDEPFFLWDAGSRRLTLLEVNDELRAALEVLDRYGGEFPPEALDALLPRLAEAANVVPIAMPRSVMGEAVVAELHFLVRIAVEPSRAVRVELRVRPLPESASFTPGSGARDVHVRRGVKALHARRDFDAEREAAERWVKALDLGGAVESEPFTFEFALPDKVLTLLQRWPALSNAPELEWAGTRLVVLGQAGPPQLRVELEQKREWFGAFGELSIASERVKLAVALDLARRERRWLEVTPGSYVEISDALAAELKHLADHAWDKGDGTLLTPSAVDTLERLRAAGAHVQGDADFESLRTRAREAAELKPKVPKGLKAKLRDYQREGFEWLARLAALGVGGVLADDMGLGKTVQTLALLQHRASLGPALVLAPTSVAFNWVDEAARFAPGLRFHNYGEAKDRLELVARLKERDVLVSSYGLLVRDVESLRTVGFSTLVFDEAQALKNAMTQRTRAALALHGELKVALSGTPLENHLGELWSLFQLVNPALLGSWDDFRTRYAMAIEKQIDPRVAQELGRVLQPFLLRRTKEEVAPQLPPRTEVQVPVVLSSAEWQLYEDARLALLSDLETPRKDLQQAQRRLEVLAGLTRLRLLASHPRLYDPSSTVESSKLNRALELIEQLRLEGRRALVFSQFVAHLSLLREVLDARGVRYVYLDGATPASQRKVRVREFQEGTAPLFLISLKAGGTGLNLTGADVVIHLDPWWNPAVEDQATDRAHRIGQRKPVTVYRLLAKGTLEETMLALQGSKRALVAKVLEGKAKAPKLSTDELLKLLRAGPRPASDE